MSRRKKRNFKDTLGFLSHKGSQLKKHATKILDPAQYVENELISYEHYTQSGLEYAKIVQAYLSSEREKRISEINDAILSNVKTCFSHQSLSRIVSSKFSYNPLCSFGSVHVPPGGRFNTGHTSYNDSDYFQALYVANDYDTAFAENFYYKDATPINDFSHYKLSVKINKYIDLREDGVINDFFNAIKDIDMPSRYDVMAKTLRVPKINLATTSEQIKTVFFIDNFRMFDTWLDQYAPSQIFGSYVYNLGISAIVFPSTKFKDGFNLAIYYDNFKDTDNQVELIGEWPNIHEEMRCVNSSNFNQFMQSRNAPQIIL